MRRSVIGLVCAGLLAVGGTPAARQYVPPVPDVVGALQRFHTSGTQPEESSLEFHDLLRGVLASPGRDPFGNLSELASRVFTRTHVELAQPLIAPGGRVVLRAALWTPPLEIDVATRYDALFDASLDGSVWFPLVRATGDAVCEVDLQRRFGAASMRSGWHSLATRVTVSARSGLKRGEGACAAVDSVRGLASSVGAAPFWHETRTPRPMVYGVLSAPEVQGTAGSRLDARAAAPPDAWPPSVLEATAAVLDPALPVRPLATWVRETLARAGRGRALKWDVVYCGADRVDRFPDRSRAEVCVRATDGDSRLAVSLEFSAGPLQDDLGLRRAPDPPEFRTGFVAAAGQSLELKKLSDLAAALAKPPAEWPAPDLRVSQDDIAFRPPAPFLGDVVSVIFAVHNDGPSDERALIAFALSAPGMAAVERGRFFADVPAGGVYQFTRAVRLPMTLGAGHAAIDVQLAPPRGSMRPVRERRVENNAAAKLLGAWRRRY